MITALDLAWEKINALGGKASEYDDFGRGINHAVDQALSIIEDLGGSDPLPKRAARAKAEGRQPRSMDDRGGVE